MTRSAFFMPAIAGASFAAETSATKSRPMVIERPPRVTSAVPFRSISSSAPPKLRVTWEGSNGAPMVATAFTLSISGAALSTAAPPSEWPIISDGGRPRLAR